MDDLVQWLTAQLDEDEEVALGTLDIGVRAAMQRGEPVPRWEYEPDSSIRDQAGTARVKFTWADSAAHIVRHDPARVLREIGGKRRTLIRCQEEMFSGIPRLVHFAKQTVREMAAVYEDRPGYEAAVAAFE